ncbi:hypothetical protein MMC11_001803 [Xylographa trunciseda]|nr:hypothetical protein [Xylographa trunciseda]
MEDRAKQDHYRAEDVHRLSEGFEALMTKVEDLVLKNMELGRQLSDLQAQHKLASFTHLNTVPDKYLVSQTEVADKQRVHSSPSGDGHRGHNSATSTEVDPDSVIASWRNDEKVLIAIDVLKNLGTGRNETLLMRTQDPVISNESNSISVVGSHKSIILEQDFTTQGPKGGLGCPFASRTGLEGVQDLRSSSTNRARRYRPDSLPTPPDLRDLLLQDPMAVEYQAADLVSPPASAQGAASKCPIRFLDQHSPEEVARYFQSHKHEIPRSHEVCVKRYQTNEESIRQLDAKYGNLVNMIQGLGMKHQPMLVPTDHEEFTTHDQSSKEKVERWATDCTESVEAAVDQDNNPDDISHPRSGHFDRPLQDVRVGESPSRPWGIHVPYTEGIALSLNSYASVDLAPVTSAPGSHFSAFPPPEPPRAPRQPASCPFGQQLPKTESVVNLTRASVKLDGHDPPSRDANEPIKPNMSTEKTPTNSVPASSSFVINGPIFLGYTAEQAATLLRMYCQPKAG